MDMCAEAGLATVRQVVETRQLANGMFNGEPLARKAGNLTMKSARTRRATLSLYKALVLYRCLLLYRYLLHRHDSPASALPKYRAQRHNPRLAMKHVSTPTRNAQNRSVCRFQCSSQKHLFQDCPQCWSQGLPLRLQRQKSIQGIHSVTEAPKY